MGCDHGIKWIYNLFDDCIVTNSDIWSFTIGMISNLVWVISAIPEIYTICKTKNVEGISPFLFSCLVIGDVLSLVGNIMTGGLATQIFTCFLYIACDGTMLCQYIYYTCIKGQCGEQKEDAGNDEMSLANSGLGGVAVAAAVAAAVDYGVPYRGKALIGSVFGWIGSCVYISSRVPQVMLNFKRRFVSNLSPYYFACTITGNTTYFLSLLIRDTGGQFMWKQAPWILGSIGPLACDITTAIQMYVYGFTTTSLFADEHKSDEENECGDGRVIPEL